MAKRSGAGRKTVTVANLAALGDTRLAEMLVEVAGGDANWKRRLKLELAAEVGAPDLALEIDKRLTLLANSRTRVSWRKRPDLIEDLDTQRRMIVERLAPLAPGLAFDRLMAWFDLYPGLAARVKDPKGEVAALFDGAVENLATLASRAEADAVARAVIEALLTRSNPWAGWVARAAPAMDAALAGRLIAAIDAVGIKVSARLAPVVRKLADRAGDLDAWVAAIPTEDRARPDVGAEIARRFADAGRAVEARAALDASRPVARWSGKFASGKAAPPLASDAWEAAEIAVIEAEGESVRAQTARWAAFQRTLSADHLKAYLSRLADFEDVVALDAAFAHAAGSTDVMAGLRFLMAWPALREGAQMIVARSAEVGGDDLELAEWIGRLEVRFPSAALVLIRARAKTLVKQGLGRTDQAQDLVAEAEALHVTLGAPDEAPSHDAFLRDLEAVSSPGRRSWR